MTTIGDQVTCAMCQRQFMPGVPGSTVRVYDQGEYHYCPTCWSGQKVKESWGSRVSRAFWESGEIKMLLLLLRLIRMGAKKHKVFLWFMLVVSIIGGVSGALSNL